MGCCQSSDFSSLLQSPNKEKIIRLSESRCLFSHVLVELLSKEFLANDRNKLIHIRNLRGVWANLKINNSEFERPAHSLFMKSMMADPEHFHTDKLLHCALLLSTGTVHKKVKIWFEYHDREAVGSLSYKQLNHMLKGLFDVAINTVPLLATDRLGRASIDEYINKLRKFKGKCVLRILKSTSNASLDDLTNLVIKLDINLFENTRALVLMESEMYTKNANDSYSDSEASDNSIYIKVKISEFEEEDLVVYPDENPYRVVDDFSAKHLLSPKKKIQLLESIQYIQDNFVN